jgi:hypothetical protein
MLFDYYKSAISRLKTNFSLVFSMILFQATLNLFLIKSQKDIQLQDYIL